MSSVLERVGRFRRSLPLTVLGFAAVSGLLAVNGLWGRSVVGTPHPLNPLYYPLHSLLHVDMGHYVANMVLFVPVGVLFTWLTSDRHVLAVVATVSVAEGFVGAFTFIGMGIGASGVVYGLLAAVAVRSAAVATGDAGMATTSGLALAVTVPFGGALLAVAVGVGADAEVFHFGHFFGFLFGAAVEAIYVVSEKERERFQREQESGPSLRHER